MSNAWQSDLERRERVFLARNYQRQDSRYVVSSSFFFILVVSALLWSYVIIPGVRLVFNLWVKYGAYFLRSIS